jgi:hypothetical protein
MSFISATRLRVRSILYLPAFFRANEGAAKQLSISPGFIDGKELLDKAFTFWTLTRWNDAVAMKGFRNSPAHRRAMQKLPFWCDEASYLHWEDDNDQLPVWDVVREKMIHEGKLTKVQKPSSNQPTKNYPPVKWKRFERKFKPSI